MTNFSLSPGPSDRALLRELSHRINNEFTSAINLISAGAVLADNPEVKAALSGVVDLLHNYADVHRALTIPVSCVLVDAAKYLRRLGMAMSRSTLDRMRIHLVFSADSLLLESERCWRLGLIVHELVTNAARHAFFEKEAGEIRIVLMSSGGTVNCIVSDNGSSPGSLKPAEGLKIVANLVKAMDGWIDRDFGGASNSIVLTFTLTEREHRAITVANWRAQRSARRSKTVRPSVLRSGTTTLAETADMHARGATATTGSVGTPLRGGSSK